MSETYLESLNNALHELFELDEKVCLLGEDILDPYGGAFKVSRGLSDKYPERVITTPISEAGITGIGAGMALRGLRPIVELMFGDFTTLATDQIVNHICKFRQMYNNQVEVPIVIRTPMGGGRGYGPTHSQCIEKLYLGIPGLKVVAPSHFHNSGELLKKEVLSDEPTLFIEHKLLYPSENVVGKSNELTIETKKDKLGYPVAIVKNFDEGEADALIVTYGGTSRIVDDLLRSMRHEEINLVACLPSLISAIPISVLGNELRFCGNVMLIEEGAGLFGWSAELAAQIYEHCGKHLRKPIKRVCAYESVIPAAKHLENKVLPSMEEIMEGIEEFLL